MSAGARESLFVKSFTKTYEMCFVTAEFYFNYSHAHLCFDDIIDFFNPLA